jgi:hypothetical protein
MTQTRLSSDGRFRWHEDLRVWEPIGPVPVGVETPDGRYWWDGVRWRVNLVPPEGWSRVAQDEAEERERRETGLPQRRFQPDTIMCPDCRRGTIGMHDPCDNCGLSWEHAQALLEDERSRLRRAPHTWVAGITTAILALIVLVPVVFVLFMLVVAASFANSEGSK